jgi:hypothetical protein
MLWIGTAERGWVRADQVYEVAVARTLTTGTGASEARVVVTLPGTSGDNATGFAPNTATIARFPALSPSAAHRAARELVDALIQFAESGGVLVVDGTGHVAHRDSAHESGIPHQPHPPHQPGGAHAAAVALSANKAVPGARDQPST